MLFVKCGTKSQNPSIMMFGNWWNITANFKKDTTKESFLATQKSQMRKLKMQPNRLLWTVNGFSGADPTCCAMTAGISLANLGGNSAVNR